MTVTKPSWINSLPALVSIRQYNGQNKKGQKDIHFLHSENVIIFKTLGSSPPSVVGVEHFFQQYLTKPRHLLLKYS
jgi:hypothetical protein